MLVHQRVSSMQPRPKIQNCRSRLLYKQFARTLESLSFLLSMSTLLEKRSANDPTVTPKIVRQIFWRCSLRTKSGILQHVIWLVKVGKAGGRCELCELIPLDAKYAGKFDLNVLEGRMHNSAKRSVTAATMESQIAPPLPENKQNSLTPTIHTAPCFCCLTLKSFKWCFFKGRLVTILVGGLEHEFYFSIYWE